MALIRWEPVRELGTLQNEMNRLFNTFFDAPAPMHGQGTASAQRRWIPAMDLVETEDAFVLKADLPGLSEQEVNIELEDNVLTVSGQRASEHEERREGFYRVERGWGSFSRSLTLPEGVDAQAVEANFDRGVLEIRIPKPQSRQPRKVSISVGGSGPATIEGSGTVEGSGTARNGGTAESPSAPQTAGTEA